MKRNTSLVLSNFVLGLCVALLAASAPSFAQNCRTAGDPITVILEIQEAHVFDGADGLFGGDPELYLLVTMTSNHETKHCTLGDRDRSSDTLSGLYQCAVQVDDPYPAVDVHVELWDDDDGIGGENEHIDISEGAGRDLDFEYDPLCDRVTDGADGDVPNCVDGETACACSGARWRHSQGHIYIKGRILYRISAGENAARETGDLRVQAAEVVQVTPTADAIVDNKPTIVRLDIESTYDDDKTVTVTVDAIDELGTLFQDSRQVVVPRCGIERVNMFPAGWMVGSPTGFLPQAGPKTPPASMSVRVDIDPSHTIDTCTPGTPCGSECAIVNNCAEYPALPVKPMKQPSYLFQPFFADQAWRCPEFDGDAADAESTSNDSQAYLLDVYPTDMVTNTWSAESRVFDTIPTAPQISLVTMDLTIFLAEGFDRTIGVIKEGFFDCHYLGPWADISGASAGRLGPHVVILESTAGDEGGEVVAHELGHTYGLSDAPCPLGFGANWFNCQDEYQFCPDGAGGQCPTSDGLPSFGFRVSTGQNMDGRACLMGGSDEDPPDQWLDSGDYNRLLREFDEEPDPELLWMRLRLGQGLSGTFYREDASRVMGVPDYPSESAGGPAAADRTTTLVFKDSAGTVLDRVSFTPESADTDGDGRDDAFSYPESPDPWEEADMALAVALPQATKSIDLVRRTLAGAGLQEAVTDTFIIPAETVNVSLLNPQSSVLVRPGDVIPIEWMFSAGASMAARSTTVLPKLSFVLISPDNGTHWIPLADRLAGTSFEWHARSSGRYLVRVFATNGGNSGDSRGESDLDQDGCGDSRDPHPTLADADADGDGVADACDNCPTLSNRAQQDADQDLRGDACDNCPLVPNATQTNTDGDSHGDACDCAPANPSTWEVPAEVTGLRVSPAPASQVALSWDPTATQAGSATVYDVITGSLSALHGSGAFSSATCLEEDTSATSIVVAQSLPPTGDGFWYLVRGENPCGMGSWGDATPLPDPRDVLDTLECAPPAPVLSISKTDSPDPVPAGGTITYTISYQNTGNANATGVMIADTVPANTAFVSATGGGTPDPGAVVHWNLGTLAAGASGSVQMTVRVTSSTVTTITNGSYAIDSAETTPVSGAAVATTVLPPPTVAIDLDPATPAVINAARTISIATGTLDVGVIVNASGTAGFGDIQRIALGVINAFNTGGATVTGIATLSIVDLMPPAVAPNNATFAALAGEFQFGAALVERGVPGNSYAGPAVQYARFRITFGARTVGSTVRVFIGDAGPGHAAVRSATQLDISGDATADGTPVGGVAGSDQGAGAGIHYADAVITFGP